MTVTEHLAFALRYIVADSEITFPIAGTTFAVVYAIFAFSSKSRGLPALAPIASGLAIGAAAGLVLTAFQFPLPTAVNYSIGAIAAGAFSVIYLAREHLPNKTMEPTR